MAVRNVLVPLSVLLVVVCVNGMAVSNIRDYLGKRGYMDKSTEGERSQPGETSMENALNEIMANAFRNWADVTPLNFRQIISETSDLDMFFVSGFHGDLSSFDGPGGVLAHAFFPGQSSLISGDTHFDESEQWTANTNAGINLEIVATHEFGHALGLGHSDVPAAIMAPFYTGFDPNYSLDQDDINGIQSLYGSGMGSVDPIVPPTTPAPTAQTTTVVGGPATTTPTGPATTTPTEPATTPEPVGPFCDLTFTAIFEDTDGILGRSGLIYAFNDRFIYTINTQGVVRRRRIRRVLNGAPGRNINAAVYDHVNSQLHLFRGGTDLDQGFPARLPTRAVRRLRPDAAIQQTDNNMFFFRRNRFTLLEDGQTTNPAPYPLQINSFFEDASSDLDAAFTSTADGFTYFFQDQSYWKYNSTGQLQSGYPRNMRGAWLACGPLKPR